MQLMQWQEHMKSSSPSSSNPTKATKDMEEYERKNKENTKELQDLDPQGSPHLEEMWIHGNVNLDLLSLFPQKDERFMVGIVRKQSFLWSIMEEKACSRTVGVIGEEEPLL